MFRVNPGRENSIKEIKPWDGEEGGWGGLGKVFPALYTKRQLNRRDFAKEEAVRQCKWLVVRSSAARGKRYGFDVISFRPGKVAKGLLK